jgi:hypothetical protein
MAMLKTWSFVAVFCAALLTSVPIAAADGPYEPNESVTQAAGPLAGGSGYDAAIETSNDEDWFYFYTSGQRQFEVVLTYRGQTGIYGNTRVTLRERDGGEIDSTSVDEDADDRVGRLTFTSPGAARYHLSVTGEQGAAYRIQVNPADALTSSPPYECFNHVHSFTHIHTYRHVHKRRHRHRSGRIHIHRFVHIHRRAHTHYQNHEHCEPAPRQTFHAPSPGADAGAWLSALA